MGRPGLGPHLDREGLEGRGQGAGLGHRQHPLLDGRHIARGQVDLAQAYLFPGGLPGHLLEQVDLPPVPTPHQSGHHVGQLEGGEAVVLLADGRGEDAALIPGAPHRSRILRAGHHPGLLSGQLDAGLFPQAQGPGILPQHVNAHPPAGVVKEDVAGVGNGLGHRLQAMGLALLPVEPALGLGALVVGIAAGV